MDCHILSFLGSSEFNPPGSCTRDPRALLLLTAPWKGKGGNSGTGLGGGRARRGKAVLRMADSDGAVRDGRSEEGEEGTATGRLGAAGATLTSAPTHGPGGAGAGDTVGPARRLRGWEGGRRRGQEGALAAPRGERGGGRCGGPGPGSLTAGRGGTQRPWHLRGSCGTALGTEPSRGVRQEGKVGARRTERERRGGGRRLRRRRASGRRGGTRRGRGDPPSPPPSRQPSGSRGCMQVAALAAAARPPAHKPPTHRFLWGTGSSPSRPRPRPASSPAHDVTLGTLAPGR